ncbi:MAG: PSP1 C-terminal domain-containing protein, partial [Candidatus Dormibacteria bacterium]
MPLAVGVKFRRHGPLNYYAPPSDEELAPGCRVLAETARGPEIGEVVMGATELAPELLPRRLEQVIRRATDEDLRQRQAMDERLPAAMAAARELVARRDLPVKVARAEINFEGSRILFDLTAERQTRALTAIMTRVLGPKRLPMLIVDSPGVLKDRLS